MGNVTVTVTTEAETGDVWQHWLWCCKIKVTLGLSFSNTSQRCGPASYWSAVSPSSTGSQRLCECVTKAATVSIGGSQRKPGQKKHSWGVTADKKREKKLVVSAFNLCLCWSLLESTSFLILRPAIDASEGKTHWSIKSWLIKRGKIIIISGLLSCVPSRTVFVVVFLAAK